MTITSLPPQVTPRQPFWLTHNQRTVLAEAIVTMTGSMLLPVGTRAHLEAVLTELGVAEARDVMWPVQTQQAREMARMPADALPVRMSREEVEAVTSMPTFPGALQGPLSVGVPA